MSGFNYYGGDRLHHVELFFKHSTDETTLVIFAVGYSALKGDDGTWSPENL